MPPLPRHAGFCPAGQAVIAASELPACPPQTAPTAATSPLCLGLLWLGLLWWGLSGTVGSAAEPEALPKPLPRTPWTTSNFRGRPEPPVPFRPRRIYPQAAFKNPTVLTSAPGTDRFFVAEQTGKIYSLPGDRQGGQPQLFLDPAQLVAQLNAAGGDPVEFEAVYGLAFPADFATSRLCYLCYVVHWKDGAKGAHPEGTRVVRLKVSAAEPPTADPASEQLLISWLQGGHNGGCLKFGPDGCLYISSGDGGPAFPPDPLQSGQDVSNLLSSILRIDVRRPDQGRPYTIPTDNPFVDLPNARGEVWAYGLRNPWKMSFDRQTGELWVGDVGWELWELVHKVHKADNFGWSLFEGRQPVHAERTRGPSPVVPPTVEIPHTEGASVTGGFVYRGERFPELRGLYLFGDWETRRIWGVDARDPQSTPRREIVEPSVRIVDFAEDHAGELYLLDYDAGTIHELEPTNAPATDAAFPRQLSRSGIYADVARQTPAAGVLPFEINAELWADGATAERFLGLPGNGVVKRFPSPQAIANSMFQRSTEFPTDTVLVKTLSLPLADGVVETPRAIETQILHFDGRDWRGYSYRWNDEQTDAQLVDAAGDSRVLQVRDANAPGGVRQLTWKFSSRTDCLRCHNPWPEYLLAFNLPQLNRDHEWQGETRNQLATLQQLGVLVHTDGKTDLTQGAAGELAGWQEPALAPRLPNPFHSTESLDERARAYLHVQCAHCHRFGGGGSAYVQLNKELPLAETRAVGIRPAQGTFGIHDAELIAPGDPYRSTLFFRMAKLGPGHMPHIGSSTVDTRGLALVHDWIAQLPHRPADALALDKLLSLEESAAVAREQAELAPLLRRLALENARAAGRPRPTEADFTAARAAATQQAEAAVGKRTSDRPAAIAELLQTPPRAALLHRAMQQERFAPATVAQVLERVGQHGDPAIRDLFESFLPEAARAKRLGEAVQAAELLKLAGDSERGRKLFHEAAGVSCRNCHRVGETGRELGPELTRIGSKQGRAKLLENILEPSKSIEPQYVTWVIETKAGKVISGLLVEKSTTHITVRDIEHKEHRLPLDETETVVAQQKSLMPELQLKDLTAEQVADLLAYLESLK